MILNEKPRIIVSLTTSPKRIKQIEPVLNSIINQTLKPDRIYLNLPHIFKRDQTTFEKPLPYFITHNPLIYVNWCEDVGPATKVLPTANLETDPNTLILSIDDDIYYPPNLLETFIAFAKVFPDACITGTSFMEDKKLDKNLLENKYGLEGRFVELVEGYSGVMYRRRFFNNFNLKWLDEKSCKFGDDFYISNELKRNNIPIVKIGYRYLPITKIQPLDYGKQKDALHMGAIGGNDQNYFKCSTLLEENNELFIDYYRKKDLKTNINKYQ
jgi:hypothetical protein